MLSIIFYLDHFSEMIASLKKLESEPNYNQGLLKASTKLGKASTEADIRLLVDGLLQKNSEDMYIIAVFMTFFIAILDI